MEPENGESRFKILRTTPKRQQFCTTGTTSWLCDFHMGMSENVGYIPNEIAI